MNIYFIWGYDSILLIIFISRFSSIGWWEHFGFGSYVIFYRCPLK